MNADRQGRLVGTPSSSGNLSRYFDGIGPIGRMGLIVRILSPWFSLLPQHGADQERDQHAYHVAGDDDAGVVYQRPDDAGRGDAKHGGAQVSSPGEEGAQPDSQPMIAG